MMKNGNEKLKFIVWQKIHLLPAWCIDLWQKWKFRTIVKHAYEKIPLYRALWQEKGIIEKNIKKVSIRALPIISKNNFTERNTDEYICQDFPEQFYNWRGATSGSTGEPFKFVRASYGDGSPEVEKYYDSFKRWRFLVWDGISFDYIFNTLRGVRFQETSHLDLTTLLIKRTGLYQGTEKTVDRILNFKGEVIGGYSSGLVEFCTVLHNHDLVGAITFKYAASSGEVLLPSQRQFIEQTLGCEVYDRYGTEEFRIIGVECREHRGFHLNSESFILEVVDESGQLIPPEQYGRIIITDLYNHVMPFIRCDIGDYGKIFKEKCPCGLKTIRFAIEGRRLSLSFGLKEIGYHDINFNFAQHAGAILQWQLRKKAQTTLEVVLVCSKSFKKEILKTLEQRFKNILDTDINILFKLRGPLERISEGKCRLFVDETEKSL